MVYGCKGRSTARLQAKLELHWQVVRTYGNKRGPNDPATVADKSTEVALMCGYHTTVTPWIVGDKEAREILGLTTEDSEQVLVLRDCILRHCFRELDTIDDDEWQNQMSSVLKWQEHASRMRLLQSSKEADLQNVELPTLFVMES